MTEQQFWQPLYHEFESLGLFVYILIIIDLSAYSNEQYEWLLLGACAKSKLSLFKFFFRFSWWRWLLGEWREPGNQVDNNDAYLW